MPNLKRLISKIEEKNFGYGFISGVIIFFLFQVFFNAVLKSTMIEDKQEKHIRSYINKNCNDCHLGKSFVNIFESKFIKSAMKMDNSIIIDHILCVSKLKTY